MYVNGLFLGTVTFGTTALFEETTAFFVGLTRDDSGLETGFLGGKVADPRVYDYALSAAEVGALYLQIKAGLEQRFTRGMSDAFDGNFARGMA